MFVTAAAAANGGPWLNGATQEEWTMDYYEGDSLEDEDDSNEEEEEEDDDVCTEEEELEEEKANKGVVDESSALAVAAELIREEEDVEEEHARRAAKKGEKKVRKWEKARRKAALKSGAGLAEKEVEGAAELEESRGERMHEYYCRCCTMGSRRFTWRVQWATSNLCT